MQIVRRVLASLAAVMLLVACTDDDPAQPLPTFTSPAGVYNDADVHFAQQMGPHHDQAVEMSKMVLAKQPPASTDVREIAEQIRATQESEIEIINGWLTAWGRPMPSAATTATITGAPGCCPRPRCRSWTEPTHRAGSGCSWTG